MQETPTSSTSQELSPATILVVEDDEDVLEAIDATLTNRGYRVLCASDGVKALTILANVRVDLILLDLTMPVMSGWEFLEAKVADPMLLDVPVVVVTAVGSVIRDYENPPWVAIVEKPFRIETLVAAVDRHRRRAR